MANTKSSAQSTKPAANTSPVEEQAPAQAEDKKTATKTKPVARLSLERKNRSQEAKLASNQQREDLKSYSEGGCFYASSAPVANSIGGEVGIVTRDKDTGEVYRSGIGFYLRSDHMCKLPSIDMSDIDI